MKLPEFRPGYFALGFCAVTFALALQCRADTLTLASPSPSKVIGHQCGLGTSSTVATGFSDDGLIVFGITKVSTRCNVGGRGSRIRTYSGCGISSWNLDGMFQESTLTACFDGDPDAVYDNGVGYLEYTASGYLAGYWGDHIVLVRPEP